MPPIETTPTTPVGRIEASSLSLQTVRGQAASTGQKATNEQAPIRLERSDALEAGQAPVDSDRVVAIRKAIESGTYPLVPAKVADAMIAAGLLLRTSK